MLLKSSRELFKPVLNLYCRKYSLMSYMRDLLYNLFKRSAMTVNNRLLVESIIDPTRTSFKCSTSLFHGSYRRVIQEQLRRWNDKADTTYNSGI